jgi:hypothetical protein
VGGDDYLDFGERLIYAYFPSVISEDCYAVIAARYSQLNIWHNDRRDGWTWQRSFNSPGWRYWADRMANMCKHLRVNIEELYDLKFPDSVIDTHRQSLQSLETIFFDNIRLNGGEGTRPPMDRFYNQYNAEIVELITTGA